MPGLSIYYEGSTSYLILDELHDSEAADGVYINTGATVTCEAIRLKGVLVTGATYPISMTYVGASNGKYRGKIPETLAVVPGKSYEAQVKVVVGTDQANFYLTFPVRKRTV